MNKNFYRFLLISGFMTVIALCLVFALSYLPQSRSAAQTSLPASKAALKMGNIAVMDARLGAASSKSGWQTMMSTTMKTSQQKDMIMTASMEVGLYTRTLVKSKLAVADTSSASAGVEVRVVVDEGTPNQRIAEPGDVVFGRRTQELTATFQGLIDGCLSVDATTGAVILDPTCVTPETLSLVLDTMSAATFVFALPDMGSGTHTVKMQARMTLNNTVQTGEVEARATIGKGSMAVEEVRLVRGAEITL